ncbi:MAG: helix-turn-helix transcriptional regulator [Treponema sp.]|jgi:transcriptional regulator with XRE-family HTH domain|nr:helix-turn-helix transcriptional regulator [Treponema sp.]
MIDTRKVGEHIAELRRSQGITGERFAELLDVSPQAVSKWENGKNLPETSLLPAIAKLLKTSIDSILIPQPISYRIKPRKKMADYTGRGWPHSSAYPALFTAVGLFYGYEQRLNEKGEQINDDFNYHIQAALTSEAYGVQYSELFDCDCLQRCLGIYGITPRVVDCSDMEENHIRDLLCTAVAKETPVIVEPQKYADILFVFGYKEAGDVLCCCAFLDGADDKNISYNFAQYRTLRNRTHKIKRIIILEETGQKIDINTAYEQSLRHGLQMMTSPSKNMIFGELRGAGSQIYDSWIALLEKANKENSENFYMEFPVYPQFIILYERFLHLNGFLKAFRKTKGEKSPLIQAQKKCDKLEILAMEAAQIGYKNVHSRPEVLAMTNNERRNLLIDILTQCRETEQEMIFLLQEVLTV